MNILLSTKPSRCFEFLGCVIVLYFHVSYSVPDRSTLKFINIALFLFPNLWLQNIAISFNDLQLSMGFCRYSHYPKSYLGLFIFPEDYASLTLGNCAPRNRSSHTLILGFTGAPESGNVP